MYFKKFMELYGLLFWESPVANICNEFYILSVIVKLILNMINLWFVEISVYTLHIYTLIGFNTFYIMNMDESTIEETRTRQKNLNTCSPSL